MILMGLSRRSLLEGGKGLTRVIRTLLLGDEFLKVGSRTGFFSPSMGGKTKFESSLTGGFMTMVVRFFLGGVEGGYKVGREGRFVAEEDRRIDFLDVEIREGGPVLGSETKRVMDISPLRLEEEEEEGEIERVDFIVLEEEVEVEEIEEEVEEEERGSMIEAAEEERGERSDSEV